MISSTANKQIKYVSALVKKARTRKEEGLFVAEGLRMCSEVPVERLSALYISESFSRHPECRRLTERAPRVELVSDEVFASFSDTQSPQGALALVEQYQYTLEEMLTFETSKTPILLMVLERIQDPGNLGTIIRAGEGAGITGVLMDQKTVDIYNPKVIRSTMGSVFRVPFVYTSDLHTDMRKLKEQGICIYAAHLDSTYAYDQKTYLGKTAFLIGNEANGLSEETASFADGRIQIPMLGQVESLNAAVAASILMYEAARQRRNRL